MNEEKKWTPGPWKFFAFNGAYGAQNVRADVAHCQGFDSLRSPQEERANAHLIAAAPELYEALEWAMRFVDQVRTESPAPKGGGEDIAYQEARAALAKARGES